MKIGLVLEGGALRTIYSTGILDVMLEGGIMPDYFVGASAGVAYGTSYLARQPKRNLDVVSQYVADRRYMGIRNLADRNNRSYFGIDFTYNVIPNELVPFDYDTFASYPGDVEAVVTNIDTGKPEYLEVPRGRGENLVLQATCAMPLMFPIYHIDGKPYLDGGASDPVPWKRAFDMGCDRIMVILTKPRSFVRKPEKSMLLLRRKYRDYPKFIETMENRHINDNESRRQLFELEKEGKALVFAPESSYGVSRVERDTEKLRMLWGAGYQDAVKRMGEIRTFFNADEATK